MTLPVPRPGEARPDPSPPLVGVANPRRLAAVADAELSGHLADPALDAIVNTLQLACRVRIAVVNIVAVNSQTYPAEAGLDAPCSEVPDELSFCAEVVDTGQELLVPDATAHPVYRQNPLVESGAVLSYAGCPLVDNGAVLGSVSVFDDEVRHFTPAELRVLRYQTQLASAVLALRRAARTDWLTGLGNRNLLFERAGRMVGRGRRDGLREAVLVVDVDRFKAFNDQHGQEAGDALLVQLSRRLSASIAPSDLLVRFGGDRFVAVCGGVSDDAGAARVAQRMIDAAAAPGPEPVADITLSIGIAVTGAAEDDIVALLRAAELAMYRAKRIKGSQWRIATAPLSVPVAWG
jgi:diguanylate cyclase (GGDEF)-like protein